MKTGLHRILVAVLAVALTVTMFPLPAFAVDGNNESNKGSDIQGENQIGLEEREPAQNQQTSCMARGFVDFADYFFSRDCFAIIKP